MPVISSSESFLCAVDLDVFSLLVLYCFEQIYYLQI